ncbi:hypothetical protein JTE90_013210 [Oedothorax gibbosus]|uniref:Chitin-binding type-2 domain-containing protein n=1 Tax=Oedothorax gibbosus TaxID=931172 RepID=A0AAV6UJ12_9ARAC|nr:hypothetical protein JTE90_013210 [Oedothorax gibbosus]
MIVLGPIMAHCIAASVIIVLLLDRRALGAEKLSKHSTSPWFPAGPPPSKPSPSPTTSSTQSPEALLQSILPKVTFDCSGKTGYFPDIQFHCEVFHYCKSDGGRTTFACPHKSIFNQLSMVCEERTAFNVRICKEGAIGAKKKDGHKKTPKHHHPKSTTQQQKSYKEDAAKQHRMSPIMTTRTVDHARTSFSRALEDLLGYMNSDQQQAKKTFDPSDHIQTSSKTASSPKTTRSMLFESSKLTTTAKPKFSRILSNVSLERDSMQTSESRVIEDFSKEYDAIEGRRPPRQHKAVGRVLDVPHKRSHVSARSPTEPPPTKAQPITQTTASSTTAGHSSTLLSTPPSLFNADRSKAKDFRKRRRNNRKRKNEDLRQGDGDTSEATTTVHEGVTDAMDSASDIYPQQVNPENSLSWMGVGKNGEVKPYTLPPLPIPKEEHQTTSGLEPVTSTKRKRTRRPSLHGTTTTTPLPDEDFMLEMKFGEKISELSHHQYGQNSKTKTKPSEYSDLYDFEDIATEDYTERYSTTKPKKILAASRSKPKESNEHVDEDERFFHYPLTSTTKKIQKPEDLFPPPRAEPREQKSSDPYQHIYDKKTSFDDEEVTTTDEPTKTTFSYVGRHRSRSRGQPESKWKISERKKKEKVNVGSIFHSESTVRPRLQVPPTEDPMESEKDERSNGIASAQQNLLKLMNDFFAMSSTKSSTEESDDLRYMDEETVTPSYKESEEDMHRGESIHEDIEEIPPELLDMVDFISEQSDEDKRNLKSEESHEIIKISGPITNKHLKEILSDNFHRRKKPRKEPEDKYVVMPSEDKENLKDLAEVAQFASTRLGPLLKQMASDKTSVTVIPMKRESEKQRKPAVMSAKKIPVRVFYKETASTPTTFRATPKPMLKVVRSQLPNPSLQIIQSGRITPSNTYSQPHYKTKHLHSASTRPVVIHPKSMYPPHPPPLHKKAIPFGFPFAGHARPFVHPMRYMSHRKKRSVLKRERRQLRPNPPFLPFPRPVFPTFNPKFAPNFSPFKSIFAPNGLSTAGSSHSPFHFPKFDLRKPAFGESSSIYSKFPHSPPAPVRHITQSGDQTVIVEEVPVPIHVEVPDPNLLRPVHPGNHKQNLVDPFPSNNQFRAPSPSAVQHPPLMQGFQGRFPVTNNYRPYGLPSNVRPPLMNYHSSMTFAPPLPPTISNQGHLYALGVTNKPFLPSQPPPGRSPNSIVGAPPAQHFPAHSNSYPNYPYFQGSLTTPIADGQIPGRVMFSGYKPPKTTIGTKLPRTTRMPNRERKVKPENGSRPSSSKPRPSQSYYHVTNSPPQTYYNTYKEPRGRTPYEEALHKTFGSTSPSPVYSSSSPESPIPRRRPYKKRRPRPPTSSSTASSHVSPTPRPPEQVPPPLADFTSLPLQNEAKNSIQNTKDSKPSESSSLYPPAGYYGKDQLLQFFDSSSKSYNKASTPKSMDHNDLGENTSSAEVDETVTSLSGGDDSEQPAFGTRLKGNSDGRKRKKKRQPIQAPTQKSEVRTRPSNSPDDGKRSSEYVNRKPNRNQVREENSNGQRRPQYRPRNRPTPMPSHKPETHHFKYDGNTGGFYSVPSGLQTHVDPSYRPPQRPGSTDMFGIPHPAIDKSTYSLRPQGTGGPDFNSNFFSVPSEVAKQQKSSLHIMNTRPMPDSAREFFEAAVKESSKIKETSEDKENEEQSSQKSTADDKKQQSNPQVVRKLRKPKRKNRYNPRNNEDKLSASDTTTSGEPKSTSSQRSTTPATTTTNEPNPASTPNESANSPNDIKEQAFKSRSPLLPKALPDLSQKLPNGKIDYKKLNATISTSVSVSGAFPTDKQVSSETASEDSSKRVFSSQNGGLAVVKSNPKRKRTKQKLDRFGSDEESSAKTKYDIAASVLDIIKATAETEKLGGAGFYSNRYSAEPAASSKSSAWDLTRIDYNRTTSTR